jgi:hypothetical protein
MSGMDNKGNEPQSYGSEKEWVTGETGQEVNRQSGNPNSQQSDFYQSRRDSEGSAPDQGGQTSTAEPESPQFAAPTGSASKESSPGVTASESGAKRDSFFKDRDYK